MSEEVQEEQTTQDQQESQASDTDVQSESADTQNSAETQDESAAEAEQPAEPTVESLSQKIADLEKERDEYKDKWMRSVADFQNLRKRAAQEKQDAFDYGNASLLKDLLDSLDNFDRTVEAAANATDAKTIADGVTMINKSLVSMLENKYNLVAYGAEGDAFDPDIHEAIGKVDEDVAEPVLKAVYLKGYKLKDRVIRHAKVMVAMPKDN